MRPEGPRFFNQVLLLLDLPKRQVFFLPARSVYRATTPLALPVLQLPFLMVGSRLCGVADLRAAPLQVFRHAFYCSMMS